MADTFDALMAHLEVQHGQPPRIIVWAHNSHLGDARATDMGERGELSLGQLLRQRYGSHAALAQVADFAAAWFRTTLKPGGGT
jgi:erythromycin esterase-like protein